LLVLGIAVAFGFFIGLLGFGEAVARVVAVGVTVWLVHAAVGGLIGFGLSFLRPVSEWTHKQHVRRPYATIGAACAIGFAIGLAGYGEVIATLMAAIVVLWLDAPEAFSRPDGAKAA
jgi:hypothetical protein